MGEDGPDEEDPWFERLTDDEADTPEETGNEGSAADSADQWEWVQPADDGGSDREGTAGDGPDEGERVWDGFDSENPGSPAAPDPPGRDAETGVDDAEPSFEDSSQAEAATDDRPGETPPPPPASVTDRDSSDGERPTPPPPPGDTGSGGADVPPPPPGPEDTPPGAVGQSIRDLQPLYHRRTWEFYLLWLVAGLAYGLGDMLTTSIVFITPRIGESNPFIAVILSQYGLVGFVAVKLAVFVGLLAISIKGALDDDRFSYYGPPLLAILIGTGLTVWNLATILGL